jgi:hypothetical protein
MHPTFAVAASWHDLVFRLGLFSGAIAAVRETIVDL